MKPITISEPYILNKIRQVFLLTGPDKDKPDYQWLAEFLLSNALNRAITKLKIDKKKQVKHGK